MSFFDPSPTPSNSFAPRRTTLTPESIFPLPEAIDDSNPYFGNPLPSVVPFLGRNAEPTIISRLPESVKAFENKYAEYGSTFREQLSPAVYQALVEFDWNRASRGQTPLSAAQTQRVLSSIEHERPYTPPPDKSPFNVVTNVISDIGTIAKSLPALPAALVTEVASLPRFGEEYQKQIDELGGNAAAAFFRAPGVRMLPGAYTASNLLSGKAGVHEALTHPLLTGLDILPATSKLGVGGRIARLPVPGKFENVAEVSRAAGGLAGRTRVGQFAKSAFGAEERLTSRYINQAARRAIEWMNSRSKIKSPDEMTDIARRAHDWSVRNRLTEQESDLLFDVATLGDSGTYNLLSPNLKAALDDLRETMDLSAEQRIAAGQGAFVETQQLRQTEDGTRYFETVPGRPEFFVSEQAYPILEARAKTAIQSYGNSIRELLNPSALRESEPYVISKGPRKGQQSTRVREIPVERTLDQVVDFWPTIRQFATEIVNPIEGMAESMKFIKQELNPARLRSLQGYVHALEAQGIDVSDLLTPKGGLSKAVTGGTTAKVPINTQIQNLVQQIDARLSGDLSAIRLAVEDRLNPYRNPGAVLEAVKPYTYSPPFSKKFIVLEQAVRKWEGSPLDVSNLQSAIEAATQLRRVASNPLENSVVDSILESLRVSRNRAQFINKLERRYTPAKLNERQKAQDFIEQRTVPARWVPKLEQQAKQQFKEAFYERYGSDPNWSVIEDALNKELYPSLTKYAPDAEQILDEVIKGIESTWRELKGQGGSDPVYVHRTSPKRAMSLEFQKLYDYIPTLSQLKVRTFDPMNAAPYIKDIQVSLNAQHLEILSRRAMEEAVTQIMDLPFVRTADQLIDQYKSRAELDPLVQSGKMSVREAAETLAQKDFAEWNPNSIITWRAPHLSFQRIDETPTYFVPKTIKNNFDRMQKTPLLKGAADPIMNAFRTSVLPLSPRWHAYNILGGYMMLSMETNPLVAFTHIKAARELLKTGETTFKGRKIVIADELRLMQGGERDVFNTARLAAGRSMSRWFYESLESRGYSNVSSGVRKLGQTARAGIEKSFDLNQFFDDLYRSMAYIHGFDKALVKDLSHAEAIKAGMSSVRKVMHSLDSLTPIERSIMRSLFPFYGFMSHVMRFALRFPYDHPFRVSVLASFARNELEDQGTGLPEKLLGLIPIGGPSGAGTQRYLNLTGANPFSDVADLFTLQGWVGNVNPLISTALQQVGLDPATAAPELYPDVTYDAESGRLVYRAANPILSLLSNTIPQTRFLQAMVGGSREFEELARENPDAAKRLLLSNIGVPLMWRDINIPQERIKVELALERGEQEAKTQALKSGDWSEALRYPSLRAYFNQVQQLGKEQQQMYTPAQLESEKDRLQEYFA